MIIRSFPRLHIVLFDLGNITNRKYGGAGFVLDGPCLQVRIEHSDADNVHDLNRLDERGKEDVHDLLGRMAEFTSGKFSVNIESLPPQHSGLGSKTSLSLAILKGVQLLEE